MNEDATIQEALTILARRVIQGPVLNSPQTAKDYLTLKLSQSAHEVFGCIFLNAHNKVIHMEDMFRGTLTQTSVYPREIVKLALLKNAAAVIVYHCHPSGQPEPSRADELLTQTLKQALNQIDVKVLDHMIVGSTTCYSFAEHGLL